MIIFKKISSILYSPRFLLVTNTTTGVIFFGTGDVCIQKLIERKKQVERKRLVNSCIAGSYMGFVSHFWYIFLDRIFIGKTRRIILKKLMCEALVGPPFAASMFFVVGKLNHKKNQEIQSEVKTNFKYLMMVDWGFYIPLQYFNFQYLPTKFRVLYVSILSLVYDTFLVYILNKKELTNTSESFEDNR
ncbi:hypothetical protein SSS_02700 [Sarcoptes scabiei]|nr:hypothetical protein SSS_02700 [Sarcoptes scabiei]